MTNSFSKRITTLRRERGLPQRTVAADLGISQALLSHYEKGIRECGHEFLIRAANYFSVSCDYLLGRTNVREMCQPPKPMKGSPITRNKKSVLGSLSAAYEVLEQLEQNPEISPADLLQQFKDKL